MFTIESDYLTKIVAAPKDSNQEFSKYPPIVYYPTKSLIEKKYLEERFPIIVPSSFHSRIIVEVYIIKRERMSIYGTCMLLDLPSFKGYTSSSLTSIIDKNISTVSTHFL